MSPTLQFLLVSCAVLSVTAVPALVAVQPALATVRSEITVSNLSFATPRLVELFKNWTAEFRRDYDSVEEAAKRFDNFVHNHAKVHAHNRGNSTYRMEMNMFADLTREEMNQMKGFHAKTHSEVLTFKTSTPNNTKVTPVDWRKHGVVTPVKDQASCGSCWAFSATEAVESAIAIKTGELHVLSEQDLVDCDHEDNGCNGGEMDNAFQFIQDHGIPTEKEYPYVGHDGRCQKHTASLYHISGFEDVPRGEEALAQQVAIQPVSVGIEADQTSFQLYGSGIFTGPCGDNLDHGVVVVGMGHDDDIDVDFWIVRNSWTAGWGENGYIRILKGKNLCGIGNAASYPIA
jgi:KDEL-tailed cysteine endopeptidase